MGSISNPVRKQGAAVTKGTGVLTAAGHKALATSALPVPRGRGPISRLADGGQVQVSQQANGTTSFSGGNVSGAPTYTGGSPGGGGTVSSLGPSPSSGPSAAATAMNNAADIYHSMAAGASPASSAPATSTPAGAPAAAGAAPAPKDPFDHSGVDLLDHSKVDLLDPSNMAARNDSVHSVFPTRGATPAGAGQHPPVNPFVPSIAAQQAAQLATGQQFGFANGGMVPGAQQAPAAAVSPFSIRGIAQGVAGAYNGAVDKTADAMLSVRNTFGHPIGYNPGAPVGTPPSMPALPTPAANPMQPAPTIGGAIGAIQQHQRDLANLANGGPVSRTLAGRMQYVASPVTPSAAPIAAPRGVISRLASGGVIRGPGTGTSDSIPTAMQPGSYVVPADSTRKVQQDMPVNVSAGETALTPEDVHAVGTAALSMGGDPHQAGTAALDVLRQITHRNVRMPARGRANGGPISALALRRIGTEANNVAPPAPPVVPSGVRAIISKADGGVIAGSQLAAQIPTDIPPPLPPAGSVPSTGGATGYWAPAAAPQPVPPASTAPAPAPQTVTMGAPAAGPISAMVSGAPGVVKVSAPGAAPLYTNDPGSAPAMLAPSAPVTAQNQQAMDNLVAKYDRQALGGAAMMMGPSAAANLPGLAGAWIPGVNAPASQWQQENDARNHAIDKQQELQAAVKLLGTRNATAMATNENSNETQLAAAGMQQAGANQRTGMTEAGANQRAQLQSDTETALRAPLTGLAVQEGQQKILQGQQAMAAQKAYQDALASGDPKQIDAAEMALRAQTGHMPLRYEAGSGGTMGADTVHNIAVQYLNGDHTVLNGLGGGAMGAMNRAAVMQAVTDELKARGASPESINAARLNFLGDQAGATSAGKRGTQIDMAAGEAGNALQLVRQYSANVPRTQFQPLNKALNAWRTNTGDLATVQLGAALNTLTNAYSRAISPTGTPTVNDKMHAEALLNSAQTPEQTEAVLKVMENEIAAARHATADVRQGIATRNGAAPQPATAPAAAGGPQPAVLAELRRRAANDPALAQRLSSMGY